MISYIKYILGVIIFLSNLLLSYTQFYEKGQDPASIKWLQINTENFQIVFSEEIKEDAFRFANILEYIYDKASKTLNHKPQKTSILLHNHTVISNGFVTWAPKRMEAYTIPPQTIKTNYWLEELAIHEYRHVVQIDKLNQGFTKLLYYITGEQGIGAITGLMPLWFYEGDAVCTETLLTHSGDGKQAFFEKELRAITIEKDNLYSYEKAFFGSYKHFVPDHYRYGYFMTGYARKKYGSDVWANTLKFVARNPYLISPTYWSIKKETGLSKRKLYREIFTELEKKWIKQKDITNPSPFNQWNIRDNNEYTNYRFPQIINDTTIVVEKSGIGQVKEFVLVYKSGKEKHLYTPGLYQSLKLSYAKDKIIWGAYIPDIRWNNRNYYVIKSYNLKTGKVRSITRKTRLFAPDINKEGTQIAAVKVDSKNQIKLVIIDVATGNTIKVFKPPHGNFIQFPSWHPNKPMIVMTILDDKGKSIMALNTQNGVWDTILPPSHTNLSKPVFYKNHILYRADYTGIDNIYAIKQGTDSIYMVTSSNYGAYDAEIDENDKILYYSEYSSQGYNLVSSTFKKLKKIIPSEDIDESYNMHNKLSEQEKETIHSTDIPDKTYETQPYRRLTHLFNIHSWAPIYEDPDIISSGNIRAYDPAIGGTILSQNLLGTAITTFGYEYKNNAGWYHPTFTYKGLFPVFSFAADIHEPIKIDGHKNYKSDNLNITGKIYIPFNLTRNRFFRNLKPSLSYEYEKTNTYYHNQKINSTERNYLNYGILASNTLKTSSRDITPRWGQIAIINYYHTILNGQNTSVKMISGNGTIYFPGIGKHHSLKIRTGYIKNLSANYKAISTPSRIYSNNYYADEMFHYHNDYYLPILYPDLNITAAFYLKRVRATLFSDYILGNDPYMGDQNNIFTVDNEIFAYGAELWFDYHLFHFIFPISSGVRWTYNDEKNKNQFEFVFDVTVNRF